MSARIVFLLVSALPLALGQEFRATLVGRINDSSGAAVPAAQVTATNMDTAAVSRATATGTGDYTLPFLAPGRYKLEASHAGFKTYEQAGIALRVQDRVTVDITLEVGATAETVQVTAAPPLLDTSSASLGEVVSGRAVVDLPLNGRNPFTLVGLVPGAAPTGRGTFNFFERSSNAGVASYTISVSGGAPLGNELLLDGVSMIGGNNSVLYAPSVDATQEFKVQTNSFDAEVGRFSGGLINATTKSGTNDVHGTLFNFHRNSALNARDFFAAQKPQFQYNQFGGSVGGPVRLPKLYNGRDRTFFFFNYEGSREGVPRSFVSTVPTALERNGDFSQTFTRVANAPAAIVIYDPATTRRSGTAWVRDAFPGNVVPRARFDKIATQTASYFPMPGAVGDPVTHTNNYPLAFKDPVMDNGFIARVDHRIGQRQQVFVRTSWRHFRVGRAGEFKNLLTADGEDRYSPGISVDDTITLSPTTVVTVRYGLSRMRVDAKAERLGFDMTALGFPPSLSAQLPVAGMPTFAISGYQTIGSKSLLSRSSENSHTLRSTVLRQMGRHALRFGAEGRLIRSHVLNPGNAGSFSFSNVFTRGPNPQVASTTAGNALASFFLGLGASGSVTRSATPAMQTPYYGFFVQDDLRLTSRLSINLGLRYEWEGAETERYNRINRGFTFSEPSPIEQQARAAYARAPIPEVPATGFTVKGGLLFANVGGQPRSTADRDRNNIAPRVGVVYAVAPRTVLRGGYGIFYGPTTAQSETTQGFSSVTNWVPSLDGGLTPQDTLANPFPSGLIAPTGAGLGLMTNVGQAVSFVNPGRQNPLTHQYQFGVQRQMNASMVVEAGYSGSRGRDLSLTRQRGTVPDKYRADARQTFLQTGRNVLNDSVSNPFVGLIAQGTLASSTTTRSQLLRPYPQFTGISELDRSIGSTFYDSLQVKVSRRMAAGFSLLGAYTASKLLRRTRYLNDNDAEPVNELADYDVPQRLVVSAVYELPFGKGRRFFPGLRGPAGKLVQGWQMNSIYSAQGGVPLTVTGAHSAGRSAKLPPGERSLQRWFDTSAFRIVETLELATTSVLPDVRSQGRNQIDLSLFKDTWITEKIRTQFRAEAFNAFNRTEFGSPNMSFGSASFGVVNSQINFARQIQLALKLIW